MTPFPLALLLALPASAEAVPEWRDLQARCRTALDTGAALSTDGLRSRPPTLIPEIVDEAPFGLRIDLDVLRTSARTVPAGIWAYPGGQFEMRLLEFTTRPGTRALCEVFVARDAEPLTEGETEAIFAAFRDEMRARVEAGAWRSLDLDAEAGTTRLAVEMQEANPRGCLVTESVTSTPAEGYFRSSVGEGAGRPDCGGLSLEAGRRALQEAAPE